MKRYIAQSLFAFVLLALSMPFIVNIAIHTEVAEVMWAVLAPIASVIMIFITDCFKEDKEEFVFRLGFATIATFLIFICIDVAAIGLNEPAVASASVLSAATTAVAGFREETT